MAGLELESQLVNVGNVADNQSDIFGPNPLMKVPTLVDGDQVVMESDHIAQYLVRTYVDGDPYLVGTEDVEKLNARAVMNGIMAAEVTLILASRTGIRVQGLARFEKIRESMHQGLTWLESRTLLFSNHADYASFHLVAMWDHLALYGVVPLMYPGLQGLVDEFSKHSYISESAPG